MATILPKLIPYPKHGLWTLTEAWERHGHVVPAGYVSDLDTIPKIPLFYTVLKGRARWSALMHDYLYDTAFTTRLEADLLFLQDMQTEGVRKGMRYIIYYTIRCAGWYRWNRLRKEVYSDDNFL